MVSVCFQVINRHLRVVAGRSLAVSRCSEPPTAYIGKSFKIDGFKGELDICNIGEVILRSTGRCINSSKCTRILDFWFSFALESSEFDRAMNYITRFKDLSSGREVSGSPEDVSVSWGIFNITSQSITGG
jgi:hypothetical protein